ncbi:tropomyosin-like isoform X2 [Vidua chalybeata]|uniref:tropomyosin-like isoform X2 n=1 Tax=Vidua chalybeata TaxID=81927 RepID=UPI0023A9051F|nr:tropomyosin-like isoform X2 [Vidua chalybeata]
MGMGPSDRHGNGGGRAWGGKSGKRSLGAELDAERERVHELEAELKALRGRSQRQEAELEAERRRGQHMEAVLEVEKGRSQSLEAELKSERGRSQALEVERDVLRGRGQRVEAELEAEKGRSQLLEMELETLRGRGLDPEGAEPSPEQVLLGRWRQKVFQLLLQVRLQQGQELQLQGQVRSLGAAVAAGSRQVSLLELRLRRGEQERQALSQERLRAEAAEEELGKLSQALSRLLGTLGVALADVTTAVGALGTLSERLEQAQHRLQVLVASGRLRWQREPEGTAGDSGAVTLEVTPEQVTGWHRGDTGGGSVPRLSPPCPPQATKGGDRTRPRPGTVSLAPLVTQLQALGAAILGDTGDIGDPAVPAPPWGHQ